MKTLARFLNSFDWQVAFFTTRLLLMVIGGAAIVGFFCSLHGFFCILFILLALGGWLLLYLFFAEARSRGRAYERRDFAKAA